MKVDHGIELRTIVVSETFSTETNDGNFCFSPNVNKRGSL